MIGYAPVEFILKKLPVVGYDQQFTCTTSPGCAADEYQVEILFKLVSGLDKALGETGDLDSETNTLTRPEDVDGDDDVDTSDIPGSRRVYENNKI